MWKVKGWCGGQGVVACGGNRAKVCGACGGCGAVQTDGVVRTELKGRNVEVSGGGVLGVWQALGVQREQLKNRWSRGARQARAARDPLARYTADERRRLLRFVQRRHWLSMVATGVFIGVGVSVWWGMVIGLWVSRVGWKPGVAAWVRAEPVEAVVACGVLLGLMVCGPVAGLQVRDHWLRRVLAKHVGDATCHDCAYPLGDVPEGDGGERRCPECGEVEVVVGLRGYVPRRLVTGARG